MGRSHTNRFDDEWNKTFLSIVTSALESAHQNRVRVVVVTKNVDKAQKFVHSIVDQPLGNVVQFRCFDSISDAFRFLIEESEMMLVGPSSFAVAAAYLARQPNFQVLTEMVWLMMQAVLSAKTWERFQP